MELCRQVLQTLTLFVTKIVHFASLFLTQDTLFHYLDSCCKIPNISFADLFSIYIFLLIRSSVDDDDDECKYTYSAQYTAAPYPDIFESAPFFRIQKFPRAHLSVFKSYLPVHRIRQVSGFTLVPKTPLGILAKEHAS